MPPRTEASSGVANLVSSIKQHGKFKQLAAYSVQCLCKVITPPHVGWEKNLKDAFEAGALPAITEVLQRHSGDETVLKSSTAALSSMATNPKYAAAVVESGALTSMLESVLKNPDAKEGVTETLKLMETIATNNPEALLHGKGAELANRLVAVAGAERPHIVAACARTMEKLNKVPGGTQALIDSNAAATVMKLVQMPVKDEASQEIVEVSMRTLERICRSEEHTEYMRNKLGGMQVLSAALETHKNNDKVCKVGGRLLTKLAAGNVPELVTQMQTTKSASEKEFLAGLLANLALEEENADKIFASGGVGALIRTFESTSTKTVEASARAIGRLATGNMDGVDDLVRNGVVPSLVKTITLHKHDAGVTAAIAEAMGKMTVSAEAVAQLKNEGGLAAILSVLSAHPEYEQHTLEAFNLLENLGTSDDFDMQDAVRLNAIPAVVGALKRHTANTDILLQGTRTLIYMSTLERNVLDMVESGVLGPALGALNSDRKEVVLGSVYLITSLALVPANKDALVKQGGIDKLLGAVAKYATEDFIKETAEELLTSVIGEEQVAESVVDFSVALETLLASKAKKDATALKDLANRLAAISANPDFAEMMIRTEGLTQVVRAIEAVCTTGGIPDTEGVLITTINALSSMAYSVEDSPALRGLLAKSGAIKAVVMSVKAHPKLTKHVQQAVEFLESFALMPEAAELVIDAGAVEACVAALRANPNDAAMASSALTTLLSLASSDKGVSAVAKHGGTRQTIATIHANTGTPNFALAMEKALALLQRVALTTEGSETLVKQGGVDAILAVSEVLTKGSSSAASVVSAAVASAKALGRLLTQDDVLDCLEHLQELAAVYQRGRMPTPDVARPILSKVGFMATVGNFAETIVRHGGAASLAIITSATLSRTDEAGDAYKAEVLPPAFKCLANISKTCRVDEKLGFATMISQAVDGSFALAECLECIRNIAAQSEAAAATLVADGRSLPMLLDTLKINFRNTEIATSCFLALTALASHDRTVSAVAGTPALGMVSAWLDENVDDAPRDAVEAAVNTLAVLARSAPHASAMLSGNVMELVRLVLTKVVQEGDSPAPAVLTATLALLHNLSATPANIATVNASGAMKRITRSVYGNNAYLGSEDCISRVAELVTLLASLPEVRTELNTIGVQDLIVAGMNANGTSEKVVKAGAAALVALGAGEEAGRTVLEEVRALSTQLERATDLTEDMVSRLGQAIQRLGNFMMIPGVVTPGTAPAMMTVLSNAVALMAESEIAPPQQLAAGVQSIGRLVDMAGASLTGQVRDAVEMTIDVLSLNAKSVPIREAAIHVLGTLAQTLPGLKCIYDLGGMDIIAETARANPSDARLQALVDETLKKITTAAGSNASSLVAASGGSKALAAVIAASANDAANLSAILANVASVQGGDDALYQVITDPNVSPDVMSEALRVLRDKADAQMSGGRGAGAGSVLSKLPPSTPRVAGLCRGLAAALAAQAALTPQSDQRAKLQALRLAENTLALMTATSYDAASAKAFFDSNSLESLMQLLGANIDDEETVAKITTILRGVMEFATPEAAAQMAKPENMGSIAGTLRLFMESPAIVADTIDIMAFTAKVTGADGAGIDREAMRSAQEAGAKYGSDGRVKSAITSLQGIMSSKFVEAEAAVKAMSQTLATATNAIQTAAQIQELKAEDGRTYYYNKVTKETTWEMPAVYAEFKAAMQAVSAAALRQQEDCVVQVQGSTINNMISALNTHVRNSEIAQSAAQTLSALAMNDANAAVIAQSGGIGVAIQAMNVNPDNIQLLRVLLTLMERISRNDTYKEQVVTAGGVDIIINVAVGRHVDVEEITLKSLSTLANLAFNSTTNINGIMKKNGVHAIERSLQTWPKHPRILENAMCALSNLMYGSDENKLAIGQTCGDEVTSIIRDHPNDVNLFKMALRALGNLSFCDENIRFIVEGNNATTAIVAGMRGHPKDEEALQLAMEVIGNFASLEEPPPELDAAGNPVSPRDSISMIILREAGCAEIISTLKRFPHNSALLKAGMDALANIANDIEVTELMAKKQNLVPVVIEIMQQHDWDEELIAHAVPLLATLTYSRECVQLIAQLDGIQVLLSAMEQHGSNQELLLSAQLALTNLAASEEARNVIRNMEGVRTILALLEGNLTSKQYVEEALKTLTRLCADDKLSSTIAETGMHIVMGTVDKYSRDPEFLTSAFRLLGHLAFVESNLTIIVQHNGIQKVIQAITAHPESQPLMVRSIQTLDNIAMANRENAAIVIDEGGKELIETIIDTYPADEEIQRYGKSALLSMSALENLSKSAEISAKANLASKARAAGVAVPASAAAAVAAPGAPAAAAAPVVLPPAPLEPARPADPLAEYRHLLSAGKVMKVWVKGSPTAAHVLVSSDWASIVWQDIKSQKKLGALDLRQVTGIKAGMSDGHKGGLLSRKAADADLAFSVTADRASLDLEANTAKERATWVEGLTKLLHVFKTSPSML